MAELILIDLATKQEIWRRPMDESERYHLYRVGMEHELMSVEGRRWRAETWAWQIPEHNFVMGVTFDSWEPSACDC